MTRWAHRHLPRALLRQRVWRALRRARGSLLWTTGTTANATICITPGGAYLLRPVMYLYSGVDKENKQYRKSLRTTDLDEALDLGRKMYADVVGKVSSGRKFFGENFKNICDEWLEYQNGRVETGLITEGRHRTLKTQVKRHVVPYVQAVHGLSGARQIKAGI